MYTGFVQLIPTDQMSSRVGGQDSTMEFDWILLSAVTNSRKTFNECNTVQMWTVSRCYVNRSIVDSWLRLFKILLKKNHTLALCCQCCLISKKVGSGYYHIRFLSLCAYFQQCTLSKTMISTLRAGSVFCHAVSFVLWDLRWGCSDRLRMLVTILPT